jgi:uncharacterized membrane protein YbhN (UPF0104 family)
VGRDPGLTWLELATLVAIAGWNLSTYAWVWMAVTLARLATAIPLTPGAAGFVEAVLIGRLVAAGGARPQVVAAVLVYRVLTSLLPIPAGIGTYLWRGGGRG